MKTLLLFLLIFHTGNSITVSAQSYFVGVRGGLNHTNTFGDRVGNSTMDPISRKGLSTGLTYECLFNNNITLGADLLYDQRGVFLQYSSREMPYYIDYIALTLKAGYRYGKTWYGFANVGIVPSMPLEQHVEGWLNTTHFKTTLMAEAGGGYQFSKFGIFSLVSYHHRGGWRHSGINISAGLRYAVPANEYQDKGVKRPSASKRHLVGVKAGLNRTWILRYYNPAYAIRGPYGVKRSIDGYGGGLTYDYFFKNHWYFATGVNYEKHGYSDTYMGVYVYEYRYQNLTIPLKIGYRAGEKWFAFANAGVITTVFGSSEKISPYIDEYSPGGKVQHAPKFAIYNIEGQWELGLGKKFRTNTLEWYVSVLRQFPITFPTDDYRFDSRYRLSSSLGIKYWIPSSK